MKLKNSPAFGIFVKGIDKQQLQVARYEEKIRKKKLVEEAMREFEERRKAAAEAKEVKEIVKEVKKTRILPPPLVISPDKYRVKFIDQYFLGGGNNFELIRRVLQTRPWWESVGNSNIMINLYITQCTRKGEFEKYSGKENMVGSIAKCINRFEGFKELTDKDLMFINIFKYCEVNFELCPRKTNLMFTIMSL